ncbi:MAG: TIR domain-containing protein [Methanobacteriaceae archaeon]|nr:TIR domain-containing protein [Methanobacteriaceae archaeon]
MFEDEITFHDLFVTHNGEGDEEYITFFQRLLESPDFEFKDHGVPGENEVQKLKEQIQPAEVVIVLAGLYNRHQELVKTQVGIALEMDKPLILIRPYGAEEVPPELEEVASSVVGWNRVCIVERIEESLE